MTVRVDSLSTEVVAEAPRATEDPRQGMEWEEREKIAAVQMRMMREELRTRAEGYDD